MKSNLISAALVLCIATLASVHASPNPSCRQYINERKICIKNAGNISKEDCICNSEKLFTLYNECHGSDDPEQFFITELCNIDSNRKKVIKGSGSNSDVLMKRKVEPEQKEPKKEQENKDKEAPKEQEKEVKDKEAPKEQEQDDKDKEEPKEQEQEKDVKDKEEPKEQEQDDKDKEAPKEQEQEKD
ncbi:11687_t:CDS:1, partial [Funneliformis mosseae]